MKIIFTLLFVLLSVSPSFAVLPGEIMKNPVLESRARDISKNLRCVVCQGEDIDESNAEIAGDLRRLVRERLAKGDSDAAVMEYIRARYGDYVLLRPPLNDNTLLLWVMPGIVFCIGLSLVVLNLRRKGRG